MYRNKFIMNILKTIRVSFYKNSICNRQLQLCDKYAISRISRHESTANKLEGNPYLEKYSTKIDQIKTSDPTEFQARLEKLHQGKKHVTVDVAEREKEISKGPSKIQPIHTRPKKLDDILRTDMVDNLPAEDISKLWVEHFRDKDGICAIIPSNSYEELHDRSIDFPVFLYPLIRGSGYEFFVGQFSGHGCYFTSLANFQAYNENSPVCLTLAHYPELKDSKGIVLMRGEFDADVLNVAEAQFLANQVQIYYSSPDGTRRNSLLKAFNKEPHNFKHTDLVTELETLK